MGARGGVGHAFSVFGLGTVLGACEIVAPIDAVNTGDASEPPMGCDLLDPSKVSTASAETGGASWRVALVRLAGSSECIYMDKTEVTVAAYQAWASGNAAFTDWHSWCAAWKPSGPSNPSVMVADECAAAIPPSQIGRAHV